MVDIDIGERESQRERERERVRERERERIVGGGWRKRCKALLILSTTRNK